jgi:hypothetical protein
MRGHAQETTVEINQLHKLGGRSVLRKGISLRPSVVGRVFAGAHRVLSLRKFPESVSSWFDDNEGLPQFDFRMFAQDPAELLVHSILG